MFRPSVVVVVVGLKFLVFLPHFVDGLGRQNFECPDGFYLNSFNSVFGNDHRMYSFGCTPLTNGEVNKEKCEPSRISASSTNDMYMSCEMNQYVAGVSIIDDNKQQMWTLLCCQSSEVSISEDCTSTIFLNDFKRGFSFASGAKHVLRKWQSVYDENKKDRRWWLQTCPFTIVKLQKNNQSNSDSSKPMNFSRKVGFPFDENRMARRLSAKITNFSVSVSEHSTDDDINSANTNNTAGNENYFATKNSSTESVEYFATNSSTKPIEYLSTNSSTKSTENLETNSSTKSIEYLVTNLSMTNSSTESTEKNLTVTVITTTTKSPIANDTKFSNITTKRVSFLPKDSNFTKLFVRSNSRSTAAAASSNQTHSTKILENHSDAARKLSSYDDYYDSNDSYKRNEKQLKSKENGGGGSKIDGIFKELHNVFKNIQDGLVLAQWVLSNNNDDKSKTLSTQADQRSDAVFSNDRANDKSSGTSTSVTNGEKSSLLNFAEFFGFPHSSSK